MGARYVRPAGGGDSIDLALDEQSTNVTQSDPCSSARARIAIVESLEGSLCAFYAVRGIYE